MIPRIRGRLKGALGALFFLCLVPGGGSTPSAPGGGGWGIDACLTAFVDSPTRAAYLPQLRAAGMTFLRERGPSAATRELRSAGFRVVSFLELGPLPDPQPGDALPEDLLAVFAAAKEMQQRHGGDVDVWEMVGEPDVGYCRDLPDRVVAFQKAVYLGIKAGAEEDDERTKREQGKGKVDGSTVQSTILNPESANARRPPPRMPLVLMGALALPPGPWLERAARNGMLDYTDAYNLHFYGFAEDLTHVIRAHAAFAAKWVNLQDRAVVTRGERIAPGEPEPWNLTSDPSSVSPWRPAPFPLWITECGINAVVLGDFLNPERRKLQAEFTVATARQARAVEHVVVFMPFILVHAGDSHALTLGPDRPLPAWRAYAGYARQHPFPSRVLAMPPRDPDPVVVQWLPDNRTAIPHKVSGAYRFWQDQPIRGVLRIHNFGQAPVHGTLEAISLQHVALGSTELHPLAGTAANSSGPVAVRSSVLTIPALGRLDLPLVFTPAAAGYFRDYWEASFVDDRGRRSPICFGLEVVPEEGNLIPVPIELGSPSHGRIDHPDLDGTAVAAESGDWTGINGLIVEADGPLQALGIQRSGTTPGGARRGLMLEMSRATSQDDPLRPPVAIARVRGLPRQGFLRLQLDRPMDSDFKLRVDLVDGQGQRFTIWENFGASYFGPRDDVWLNLDDFHIYFWSRCSDHPIFRPKEIKEVRLRPYFARAHDPRLIRLSLWQTPQDLPPAARR